MTIAIESRAFGVELEIIRSRRHSNESLARLLNEAGIPCSSEGYNHQLRANWKIVSDASVGDTGCEIVSPKLYGERGIEQARTVANVVREAGCKVNVNCGFHVHVDATDLTVKHLATVATNFLWFETFFDHIMPESRRGSENSYCRSNRARFAARGATAIEARYGTVPLNAGIAQIATSLGRGSVSHLIHTVNGGDRFAKLNMTAYDRHHTVEFRQHSGTIEADKIEHWVRLLVGFVERCKVSRPRPRSTIREWTASQEMNLFFNMFKVGDATRAYYFERRKQIAKQDAQRAIEATAAAARRTEIVADAAPFGRTVLAGLAANAERIGAAGLSRSLRRRSLIRNAISQIESYIADSNADHILRIANECVRRRLLPAAVLRNA